MIEYKVLNKTLAWNVEEISMLMVDSIKWYTHAKETNLKPMIHLVSAVL